MKKSKKVENFQKPDEHKTKSDLVEKELPLPNSDNSESGLKLRNKLLNLIESSTSHGLPNIVRSSRISMKILWTVCFLAAFGVCIWMIQQSVSDFLSYDTVSKIEVINEASPVFPSVSICNVNPLTTTDAQNLVGDVLSNIGYKLSGPVKNRDYYLYLLDWANKIALLWAANPDYGDDKRKQLGKFTIIDCHFNEINCSINDFEWFFHNELGNCYRFNTNGSNGLKQSIRPGSNYGLRLQIFLDSYDNKYTFKYDQGLRILIHNSTIKPSASEGVDIGSTKQSNIAVKRTFIKKQADPYSDCQDLSNFNSEFYQFIINSNLTYR